MNRTMAEHPVQGSGENERGPLPTGEQGGLSARMRELILRFNVEERRKRREDDGAGDLGERRRQTDETND